MKQKLIKINPVILAMALALPLIIGFVFLKTYRPVNTITALGQQSDNFETDSNNIDHSDEEGYEIDNDAYEQVKPSDPASISPGKPCHFCLYSTEEEMLPPFSFQDKCQKWYERMKSPKNPNVFYLKEGGFCPSQMSKILKRCGPVYITREGHGPRPDIAYQAVYACLSVNCPQISYNTNECRFFDRRNETTGLDSASLWIGNIVSRIERDLRARGQKGVSVTLTGHQSTAPLEDNPPYGGFVKRTTVVTCNNWIDTRTLVGACPPNLTKDKYSCFKKGETQECHDLKSDKTKSLVCCRTPAMKGDEEIHTDLSTGERYVLTWKEEERCS